MVAALQCQELQALQIQFWFLYTCLLGNLAVLSPSDICMRPDLHCSCLGLRVQHAGSATLQMLAEQQLMQAAPTLQGLQPAAGASKQTRCC